MDQTAWQNAFLVEAAAAAKSLEKQAKQLAKTVNTFHLDKVAAH